MLFGTDINIIHPADLYQARQSTLLQFARGFLDLCSMEELLRTADVRNVLDLIKETHFITSYDVVVYGSYIA